MMRQKVNLVDVSIESNGSNVLALSQQETNVEYQHEILKYITEIGASLRLQMDTDTLLKRVSEATCEALRFRHSALYLLDEEGYFRVRAVAGVNKDLEVYLNAHPLPDAVVERLLDPQYKMSKSYFIPAEAELWLDELVSSYFVIVEEDGSGGPPASAPEPAPGLSPQAWRVEDLLVVPLRDGDGNLLGFLTPDAPENDLRPTTQTLAFLELFANQAAVVIEGARLNAELREALKQAQESERLKNHFLMTASHELRTPLTAIQGYLELLDGFYGTLDDEARIRFVTNAKRACDELVLLLSNVMDTSRIDQDTVPMTPGAVQIMQTVNVILEIMEPTIVREKRQVDVQVDEYLSVWVDDLRLRQVLLNIVGNALKYSPPASKLAISSESVSVEALNERLLLVQQAIPPLSGAHFVVIAVRDWGPGISLEDQYRLFTKFMRLDSAINSIQRGAGLGLYLCRQLVEAMGGAIWVESAGIAGEGSTFFIALPQHEATTEVINEKGEDE